MYFNNVAQYHSSRKTGVLPLVQACQLCDLGRGFRQLSRQQGKTFARDALLIRSAGTVSRPFALPIQRYKGHDPSSNEYHPFLSTLLPAEKVDLWLRICLRDNAADALAAEGLRRIP